MNAPTLVYDAEQIRAAVTYADCIAVVRDAMARFSEEGVEMPLRSIEQIPGGGMLGVMPGWLAGTAGFGTKIVTVFEDPERPGRTRHRGMVLLFNRQDGDVACLADAETITELRTAAASAVATDLLARPDATRLAIFGCGVQAAAHIRALKEVRRLSDVMVWNRSVAVAEAFARRMEAECALRVRAVADPEHAAATADMICTVTGAQSPILLGAWVRPGTHVNLVGSSHLGMVEVDTDLVVRGRYFADSRRSVLAAGSEFLKAKQDGAVADDHILGEIGDVILGSIPGRTSDQDITLYKSLGHIVQDLALTEHVHTVARRALR